MVVYAKIRTGAVVFDPIGAAIAPSGSIFLDKYNANIFSEKTTSGSTGEVGTGGGGGGGGVSAFTKSKQNLSGTLIPANKRISIKSDGSICLSDCNDPSADNSVGISQEDIIDGAWGLVMFDGPIAAGAVDGLGFATGSVVMLGKDPGSLTTDQGIFNPVTDTVMKVGIADSAVGTTSTIATDLIMITEVISVPA